MPVLFFTLTTLGQSEWKQSLRYDIHAKFNPVEKSLDALMKLNYTNHSPDTLSFIWFHVWPNAYRNDRTRYSDQLLENGDSRFYFSSKEQKGYLNRLDFRVNGVGAAMQDHPEYIDVVKLILPKPLLPGDSVSISVSFHVRLPYNFNGNGYTPHHVEMRNWYPEPAVYDQQGWHPMPFLVQGGAYHEAADYTAELEAPPSYRIAGGAIPDTISRTPGNNIYRYVLKNANAFAWIADTKFLLRTDTMEIVPGRWISLQYFYIRDPLNGYKKLFITAKKDIRQLSDWLGVYPHQTISIVQATTMEDQDFTGLAIVGKTGFPEEQEAELQKALVAQWFQTILMSDQRNDTLVVQGIHSLL